MSRVVGAFSMKKKVGDNLQCIKVDLPRESEKIEILILSDWHIGSPKCDFKLVQEQIKYIKENENTYCILNGDLIENSTKSSVGDVYESKLSPKEQVNTVYSVLEPIKEKILGGTLGNHCARTLKQDGIDVMEHVMARLGILERYDATAILLFLRFGKELRGRKESNGSGMQRKICYTIYCTHGSSGGRTAGAKANSLERLSNIVDSDICVISHTHFPMIFKEMTYQIDHRNSCVNEKETTFVNSGSTLKYGGYSERFSLKPSSMAQPVITLDGNKKDIKVTV